MTPSRITIVVDSRYGTTLTLAKAIAEGAANEQAEVRLRRVALSEPEFSVDTERADFIAAQAEYRDLPQASMADLEWATGIIWGSPTRYGLMSTPLRAFIDEVAPLWRQGALIGKVGAAFTSTGGMHSGNEMTLINLLLPFLHPRGRTAQRAGAGAHPQRRLALRRLGGHRLQRYAGRR